MIGGLPTAPLVQHVQSQGYTYAAPAHLAYSRVEPMVMTLRHNNWIPRAYEPEPSLWASALWGHAGQFLAAGQVACQHAVHLLPDFWPVVSVQPCQSSICFGHRCICWISQQIWQKDDKLAWSKQVFELQGWSTKIS